MAAVAKKKELLALLMMMLDKDVCECVDKNGRHGSAYREQEKKVANSTLFLKS